MTPLLDSIRERLNSATDDLLDTLQLGAPALDGFETRWGLLQQDIDRAASINILDEDTQELILTVTAVVSQLCTSFYELEVDVRNAQADFTQELEQIILEHSHTLQPDTHASHERSDDESCPASSMAAAYRWLLFHRHNPYPNEHDIADIAKMTSSEINHVSSFFKRVRKRTGWNTIIRSSFGRNRSALIAAATEVLSCFQFDATSFTFQPCASFQPDAFVHAPQSCVHELLEYQNIVLTLYKKTERFKRPEFQTISSSKVTETPDERQQTGTCTLQMYSKQVYRNDPMSRKRGREDDQTWEEGTLPHGPHQHCLSPHKNSSFELRNLSLDSAGFPTATSLNEPDSRQESRKRPRITCNSGKPKSPGTSNTSSPHIEFAHTSVPTPLSRLESRSMPCLTESLPPARARRNSETAASAPWPLPPTYPLSLASIHCSSMLPSYLEHNQGVLSSPDAGSLSSDSSDACLEYLDPTLPSHSLDILQQWPGTNIEAHVLDPSIFETTFLDVNNLDFSHPVDGVDQGWNLFEQYIAPTDLAGSCVSSKSTSILDPISFDLVTIAPPSYNDVHLDFSPWMVPAYEITDPHGAS